MKRLLVPFHMRLALNAYSSGDYTRAEKHFRRIEELSPNHRGVRHNLALTAMGRGDFAAAEPLLLAELEDLGDFYPRLRVLADLYYSWGRFDRAAEFYRRATVDADVPDHDRDYLDWRLAICVDPEAAERAREATRLYHEGTEAQATGDSERAYKLFEQCVALDPTNHPALNNMGVIRMNDRADYAGAIEAFEQAYRIQPVEIVRANLARARSMLESHR